MCERTAAYARACTGVDGIQCAAGCSDALGPACCCVGHEASHEHAAVIVLRARAGVGVRDVRIWVVLGLFGCLTFL